jgi:hypothetical protein
LALDVFRADAHLVGNGGLILSIRAEARVESSFHGLHQGRIFARHFFA